jgi:hypothetical protein
VCMPPCPRRSIKTSDDVSFLSFLSSFWLPFHASPCWWDSLCQTVGPLGGSLWAASGRVPAEDAGIRGGDYGRKTTRERTN